MLYANGLKLYLCVGLFGTDTTFSRNSYRFSCPRNQISALMVSSCSSDRLSKRGKGSPSFGSRSVVTGLEDTESPARARRHESDFRNSKHILVH